MQINFPYTKELKQLASILLNKGDEIRLVGGCVRNFLMNNPITDFDLACKYTPKQTMEILQKAKIKVIPTGIEHGTVTAIINHIPFEITTLRKDVLTFGRHAKVEFTDDYLEDAKRRDFTINAVYLDFDGNIYDYFNGIKDIKTGVIRFIGNAEERIQEDYLRILRFFRFYCHYGFVLDKEGLEACVKYKKNINRLSGERIKTEILKILKAPCPAKTLKIMQDNGILQQITNNIEFNFEKLSLFCSIRAKLNFQKYKIFSLALLLKEREKYKEDLNYFKKRWKLSNKESKTLLFLLTNNITKFTDQELKQFLFEFDDKEKIINLFILDYVLNKNVNKDSIDFLNKTITFIQNYQIPKLSITGKDLKNIGIKQGKELGEMLKKAKEIFINSDYKMDKEELLMVIKRKD